MTIPKLINLDERNEIDKDVFVDLEINQLFSDYDLLFLKYPCKSEEIINRQGIFRALENEQFYSSFIDCLKTIEEYEKVKEIIRFNSNVLEIHCRNVQLLRCCSHIFECFMQMYGYCTAVNNVSLFFIPKSSEIDYLKQSILEMEDIILSISKNSLLYTNMTCLRKGHCSLSYTDIISQIAEALGFTVSQGNTTSIPLNEILTNSLNQLYYEEINRFKKIEKEHFELLHLDLEELKNQMRFIIHVWELVQKATSLGIPHTLPKISESKEIKIKDVYGISLIKKGVKKIIPNNVSFNEETPIFFLVGANGGGKTEYLRAIGFNLILFLSGCPIFALSAMISPFSLLFTHFPKDELDDGLGRLEEEKKRVNYMLDNATSECVLLFNETFSGTNEELGLSMLMQLEEQMRMKRIFGLIVTHLKYPNRGKNNLLCPEVVNTCNGKDVRTFRIMCQANTTECYSRDILTKYNIDRDSLKKRWRKMING